MATQYWLMKTEPNVFSIDDLNKSPKKTTCWEGVRNYQARNLLRDKIKKGDKVLFYHSRVDPMAVVGTAHVVKEGYPDYHQFDAKSKYYDAKSDPDNPRWYMVDIKLDKKFKTPITLKAMREVKGLEDMMLLKKGARLSVQPVSAKEWKVVLKEAGEKA